MTLGIVGAGQLGRMMALAGYPLGLDFLFLDKDARTPGGQVGPILEGALTDRKLLGQLCERCDVVTFDWENIPVEALEGLPGKARIAPPLRALAAAQDRLERETHFRTAGHRPRPAMRPWTRARRSRPPCGPSDFRACSRRARSGYDGKGQFVLRTSADLDAAWEALGKARRCCTKTWCPSIARCRSSRCAASTAPSPSIHSI
jgi:5-(carboxyamino)imidazole ribonucleotide synthase